MKRKHILEIILLSILSAFLVTACSPSSIRIGWSCTNGINELDCNYREFTGREIQVLNLELAEMVKIKYDLVVESDLLAIQFEDPEGEIVLRTE